MKPQLPCAVGLFTLIGALLLTGCGTGADSDGSAKPRPTVPPAGKPDASPDPLDHEALGDFNGDGHDDYAEVLVARSKDGERHRGTLVVVYGSPSGLRPETAVRASAGDSADEITALVRADLDNDGYTDLVARRGNHPDPGEVFAIFGGARGLSKPQLLDVPEEFAPRAAGDFDGDGTTDLLSGGRGGTGDPGALPGRVEGRLLLGPIDRTGRAARQVPLDVGQHGYASPSGFITGDFDGDRRSDVIMTYAYDAEEDESAPRDLTPVAYYRGSPDGLVPGPEVTPPLAEAMADIDDGPRGGTAGDVDGDGVDDLVAVGESPSRTGRLTVIHGAKAGLGRGRPAQVITGKGTNWGLGAAVGDVDGDGAPDLLTAKPGFSLMDTDQLILLPGGPEGPGGPRLSDAQVVPGDAPGLPGRPAPQDLSGARLLDVDGDRRQDAVVFSPYWNKGRGAILVLPGARTGLDTEHAQQIRPEEVGVPLRLK
ncbi:FG-GAP repeat domain-containing protein [Streptomyces cavernicola]|uniref:VCBS repeat-containing protein n=1 Tax=Streptomyces cavernicola TaxID=3043613 RepID=A0ABT6SI43_9ACTN|nr:VCBS repeat-containing protein [Streptomyces sp. B-S-A6]MDI3407862.1 VCBS repeat-containing protein [Streptomyces sp. B-S-A6]